MRHRRKGSRLNRKSNQLKALLRNLVTSLVLNGSIVTTEAKVKTLIPVFDRLVIKGRKSEKREAIRDVKKVLFGEAAQRKFMEVIVPALEGRTSGFTTRTKIGFRDGDNAPIYKISILTEGVFSNQKPEVKSQESETVVS